MRGFAPKVVRWGEETGETVDETLSVDAYRNYH